MSIGRAVYVNGCHQGGRLCNHFGTPRPHQFVCRYGGCSVFVLTIHAKALAVFICVMAVVLFAWVEIYFSGGLGKCLNVWHLWLGGVVAIAAVDPISSSVCSA